jgi:hypothetical protein
MNEDLTECIENFGGIIVVEVIEIQQEIEEELKGRR